MWVVVAEDLAYVWVVVLEPVEPPGRVVVVGNGVRLNATAWDDVGDDLDDADDEDDGVDDDTIRTSGMPTRSETTRTTMIGPMLTTTMVARNRRHPNHPG